MDNEELPTSPNHPRLPRNVKLLGWASCLNDIASEMIFPLLPQFLITVLGGNRLHLGIIEGVADSVASLLKLWSGAWSDRVSKRKGFVIFGYALAAISRPLIGVITVPWQLFFARTADRIGKGIRTSPRDALIADSTSAHYRGRAFGFHRAMDHLGAAIGPVIATAFLWFCPGQLRLLFLLTVVPGLVVVGLLIFGLREVVRTEPTKEPFQWTLKPFDNNFRLYLLALVVFTLGNSSDAFLLVRASELGVPMFLLPLLWFTFHIAKSIGNLLVGGLVDRVGPRLPLFLGWFIYSGVYLAFALATTAWHAWAFFLLYAVFYSLTEPAEKTLVANLVGTERKGLAFGWYNFAIGISALPSSLIFGVLYEEFGPLPAFGWGAALALVAVILLIGVKQPDAMTAD
ncbi:MFS transporter [Bremerella sp. P1]|uniref:MFS transporter n=1 Tax=Bremerella sp. P1 TaxID=3026424 RepID=UPI0023675D0F|nr:MFS transporter [Bremerella sp. P1]WDI39893.1 MFS transporter [Bremerella sp. P1]